MKKLKSPPRAVIFDMDGVIVDSMPYHFIAWYEALRPFGIRVSCFDVYSREGERWERTLRDFLTQAGRRPTKKSMNEIFSIRQRIFRRNFKRFIFSDAVALLNCLHDSGYILGLVTGTPSKEMNDILPLRIRRLFSCMVMGDSVKRGKPHPDPYLKAARLLGLKASECVVIENAPLGVEAAKRAGMFCVAITTSLPRQYLKRADVIADRVGDIIGIIEPSCVVGARKGQRHGFHRAR